MNRLLSAFDRQTTIQLENYTQPLMQMQIILIKINIRFLVLIDGINSALFTHFEGHAATHKMHQLVECAATMSQ